MNTMLTTNKLILHGKSGKRYHFDLFPINQPYPNQSGIYIFSNRHQLGEHFNHSLIYIGTAKSFLKEIDNQMHKDYISQHQVNCIGLLLHLSETDRTTIQKDLLITNKTPCNEVEFLN